MENANIHQFILNLQIEFTKKKEQLKWFRYVCRMPNDLTKVVLETQVSGKRKRCRHRTMEAQIQNSTPQELHLKLEKLKTK